MTRQTNHASLKFIGMDGCNGGRPYLGLNRHATLTLVNMPIGLPERNHRARVRFGLRVRRMSIFSAPDACGLPLEIVYPPFQGRNQ